MKRFLVLFALLFLVVAPLALAQGTGDGVVAPVNVPVSVTLQVAQILAVAKLMQQTLNGLKDAVPSLADNTKLLRVLNFAGNLLANLGACFVAGQVHEVADTAKCVFYGVLGALAAAGWYSQNKTSDLARAASSVPELQAAKAPPTSTKPPGPQPPQPGK